MSEEAGQQTAGEDTGQQTAGEDQQTATGSNLESDGRWYESLPEDQFNDRDVGVLKRFDSVDALARGYMNAFNLVGRDKIPMPQSPEEWQEVYSRLGRPDDVQGYELNIPESLPPPVQEMMNRNLDWFRTTAFDLGLNGDQASKLYDAYTNFLQDELKQTNDRVEDEMHTAEEELRKEYGQEYESNMILANRVIDEIGGEPLIRLFEQNGMGRNPTVVKAFVKMGQMMSEETGLDKGGSEGTDVVALDDEIAAIQADPAYLDSKDPRHAGLVRKMQGLMTKRHPEPKSPESGAIRVF